MKKNFFRFFQILCFIFITLSISTVLYYFPNLPPIFRPYLNKGSIEIRQSSKLDESFLDWFNRDPERQIPTEKGIVVAPADGVVMAVKKIKGRQHIVIEMRYTDVHVQRIPISGVVTYIEGEGKALPKGMGVGDYTLDKMKPFQKTTALNTEIGEVTVRQITSFFAKRILVYVDRGQEVKIGERLGRILAGSTVVIEMPGNVVPQVKLYQDVKAGETIIARY